MPVKKGNNCFYYVTIKGGSLFPPLFSSLGARRSFLKLLGTFFPRQGWKLHVFCLLLDHGHFLIEGPGADFVGNVRDMLKQSQLLPREATFHICRIDGSSPLEMRGVGEFIHLHPLRIGLASWSREGLDSYYWSSYRYYKVDGPAVPRHIRLERLLQSYGLSNNPSGRLRFCDYMGDLILMGENYFSSPGYCPTVLSAIPGINRRNKIPLA